MGQYWMLLNLDKRQSSGELGKISESLSSDALGYLEDHLIHLDGAMATKIPAPNPTVLVKNKNYNKSLTKDKIDHHSKKKWVWEKLLAPLPRFTLGILQKVPNEIVLEILGTLTDNVDLINFSLTNTNIYFPGYKILQRRYLKEASDWEGDRIVCLGDDCEWDDVPPNLFTVAELEEICFEYGIDYDPTSGDSELDSDTNDHSNGTHDGQDAIPENLITALKTKWYSPYSFASEEFERPRFRYGLASESSKRQIMRNFKKEYGCLSWDYEVNAQHLMYAFFEDTIHHPRDNSRSLICNLSKHVYVNIHEVEKLNGDELSWASLVGSNICWTSGGNVADYFQGVDLYHGEWVGDRFACRTLDEVQELGKEQEWRDVTKQEIERIRDLWKYFHGENTWQNKGKGAW
ncbi:hypothetical protein C8Q75DRAFT_803158 [Abortiporus biennis]|nr:hypothetical protein C8Q75DRAFT_803158 [Abortiporus biennis]